MVLIEKLENLSFSRKVVQKKEREWEGGENERVCTLAFSFQMEKQSIAFLQVDCCLLGASFLIVPVTSLLLETGVRVADMVKSSYTTEEMTLVSYFWETKRWRSMFSSSAQKAKISAHAMRKQLRLRIHLQGEQGRKRHIHLHTMAASTEKWQSTSVLRSQVWLIVRRGAWKLQTNLKARPFPFSLRLWVVHMCLTGSVKNLMHFAPFSPVHFNSGVISAGSNTLS